MKAVLCRRFGPREDLRLEEVASKTAGPGEVVVRIHACGINFFDGLAAEGKYQAKPAFPFTPGAEAAGIITEVGAGVTALKIGMRVMAFTGFGGYADEVVAEAWRVFPLPDTVDFVTAAGFLITYATSHHALTDRAALGSGETLLVLGAAGGVGLAAVELGNLMGARVIAAASTDEKLDLCRAHGAKDVINYARDDLRQQIKALTNGTGVDVVYDPVGGRYAEPAVRSLALFGRYCVVGFAAGDIPSIPLNLLLLKMTSLVGVFWGAFAKARPDRNHRNITELLALHADGKLKPHIGATYPLRDFAQALDVVMSGRAIGKVVLVNEAA
jgi:NADPH:quinone reductase